MLTSNPAARPRSITVDRGEKKLRIVWSDGMESSYPLRWLRANCPCATCREERRTAAMETDLLKLSPAPPPSTEIRQAELVGNYAVRLEWSDGHATGIYAFSALRAASVAADGNAQAMPPLLPD